MCVRPPIMLSVLPPLPPPRLPPPSSPTAYLIDLYHQYIWPHIHTSTTFIHRIAHTHHTPVTNTHNNQNNNNNHINNNNNNNINDAYTSRHRISLSVDAEYGIHDTYEFAMVSDLDKSSRHHTKFSWQVPKSYPLPSLPILHTHNIFGPVRGRRAEQCTGERESGGGSCNHQTITTMANKGADTIAVNVYIHTCCHYNIGVPKERSITSCVTYRWCI